MATVPETQHPLGSRWEPSVVAEDLIRKRAQGKACRPVVHMSVCIWGQDTSFSCSVV